ncbi:MAG: hypothetical protein LLF97_09080 [Planctomycetaceae bacterium]|nr:hypothetical protein [Planctomycetaceae bacterium]
MSMEGITVGAAGSSLAQIQSGRPHAARQVDAQQRTVYHEQKADSAAGVGEPDGEDHEASERDGDGRCPLEEPPLETPFAEHTSPKERQSKDPSEESGNFLDLTG